MADAPDSTTKDGGWGWCVLLATFTSQLLFAGAVPLVSIYMIEWQEHFGVGPGAVSFFATELTMGLPAAGIFSGALCQRFGCRLVMMLGGTIGIVSTFLLSFATQLWHLHILCTIAGLGYGIAYFPGAVVIRFYFKKRLGFANGFMCAGIAAGFFAMAPLLELLCSEYGWNGALMIHAAINSNILVCGMILRRTKIEQKIMNSYRSKSTPTSPHESDAMDQSSPSFCVRILRDFNNAFAISELLRNPYFVTLILVSILSYSSHTAVLVFTGPKLVRDLGFLKSTASMVMSVYGITSLIVRSLHGFLLDFKLITVTNFYILSLVISGIQPLFNPLVTSPTGQFALIAVYGIGAGIMIPTTMLVCRHYVPIDITSSALGLLITVGGLGNILGTQLMGQLTDASGSYDVSFYVCGSFFWISAIVMTLVTKCYRPRGAISKDTSGGEVVPEITPSHLDEDVLEGRPKAITNAGYRDSSTVLEHWESAI